MQPPLQKLNYECLDGQSCFSPMFLSPLFISSKLLTIDVFCFITIGALVLCVAAVSDGRLQAPRRKPIYFPILWVFVLNDLLSFAIEIVFDI